MLKSSLLLRKIQTLRVNNSKTPRTKNVKFSDYYFYLNTNIYGDFQICISVPLTKEWKQPPVVILQRANFYNIFTLCLWQRIIRRFDQSV